MRGYKDYERKSPSRYDELKAKNDEEKNNDHPEVEILWKEFLGGANVTYNFTYYLDEECKKNKTEMKTLGFAGKRILTLDVPKSCCKTRKRGCNKNVFIGNTKNINTQVRVLLKNKL